jgi:hypothetical protein
MEDSGGSLRRIQYYMERVEIEASLSYIIEEAADKETRRKEIGRRDLVHEHVDDNERRSLSSRIRGLEHFRAQKEWERHLVMLERKEPFYDNVQLYY